MTRSLASPTRPLAASPVPARARRRIALRVALLVAALLVAAAVGCVDHEPLAARDRAVLQLSLPELDDAREHEVFAVTVFYRRQGGARQVLLERRLTAAEGTEGVTVTLDLSSCLDDPARELQGTEIRSCLLYAETAWIGPLGEPEPATVRVTGPLAAQPGGTHALDADASPRPPRVLAVSFALDADSVRVNGQWPVQATASTEPGADAALRYESRDAAVVSVDEASGVTRGRRAGSAWVVATSVADPRVKDSLWMRVVDRCVWMPYVLGARVEGSFSRFMCNGISMDYLFEVTEPVRYVFEGTASVPHAFLPAFPSGLSTLYTGPRPANDVTRWHMMLSPGTYAVAAHAIDGEEGTFTFSTTIATTDNCEHDVSVMPLDAPIALATTCPRVLLEETGGWHRVRTLSLSPVLAAGERIHVSVEADFEPVVELFLRELDRVFAKATAAPGTPRSRSMRRRRSRGSCTSI